MARHASDNVKKYAMPLSHLAELSEPFTGIYIFFKLQWPTLCFKKWHTNLSRSKYFIFHIIKKINHNSTTSLAGALLLYHIYCKTVRLRRLQRRIFKSCFKPVIYNAWYSSSSLHSPSLPCAHIWELCRARAEQCDARDMMINALSCWIKIQAWTTSVY
jgi:hypothetical protein